mmetsp:Transcript_29354/g.75700  ORF Transcript_29354/g.75700 Transcript_29354/m.75700 type:complete len:203 (-) Transcript_29354:1005-1613(-)
MGCWIACAGYRSTVRSAGPRCGHRTDQITKFAKHSRRVGSQILHVQRAAICANMTQAVGRALKTDSICSSVAPSSPRRAFSVTTSCAFHFARACRLGSPKRSLTSSSREAQQSANPRPSKAWLASLARFAPIFFILSHLAFRVFSSAAESSSSSILLPTHTLAYAPAKSPDLVRALARTLYALAESGLISRALLQSTAAALG